CGRAAGLFGAARDEQPSRAGVMSSTPPKTPAPILPPLLLWLGHLVICALLVYLVCLVMPARNKLFRDFALRLPLVSQWAVEASTWVLHYGVYLAGPFVLLLLIDGGALFLLWRWRPKLAVVWFVLIAVALLLPAI